MKSTRGMMARTRRRCPGRVTSSLGKSTSSQRVASCSAARKSWPVLMANHWESPSARVGFWFMVVAGMYFSLLRDIRYLLPSRINVSTVRLRGRFGSLGGAYTGAFQGVGDCVS